VVVPKVPIRPHAPADEWQTCLSAIERKILDRVRKGQTTEAISRELDLAQSTVELHIKHSLRKLRVRSREELLLRIAWWH
jgi:two-component system nitrate/nitrite response regulator NarL